MKDIMKKTAFVSVLLAAAIIIVLVLVRKPADPIVPDPTLTPGAIFPNATVEQICTEGYANVLNGGVRNVPSSVKKQVFLEYLGSVPRNEGDYEIDHLIPLELGGCNSIGNLWPQSGLTRPWNSRVKDRLEDQMAALLRGCLKTQGHDAATALLRQFQKEIATNWTNAYVKYVGPAPEMATEAIAPKHRESK
jgi:hypothetical protein